MRTAPTRTAVVGHTEWVEFARVSHVPAAGEIEHSTDWWEEPAGGGAVAAVQLHKLSGDCTFFTALGRDGTGKRAHLELESLGPRVEAAIRRQPTRRAVTFIDPNGERTITTLGERLHPEVADPLPWDDLATVDAVYFTAGDAGALRAARRARVLVATSRVLGLLAETDVRLDAVVGSGRDPSERYDPALLREPPGLVVVTDGPRGGVFATAGDHDGRYDPVPPPGPVVDTYGGGDSFAAGLTFALGAGLDVPHALEVAATCGAWCVAGRGPYGNQLSAADLR
jgi:ribokinase